MWTSFSKQHIYLILRSNFVGLWCFWASPHFWPHFLVALPSLASPLLASPSLASPLLASPSLASPSLASPSLASPLLASPSLASSALASGSKKCMNSVYHRNHPCFLASLYAGLMFLGLTICWPHVVVASLSNGLTILWPHITIASCILMLN